MANDLIQKEAVLLNLEAADQDQTLNRLADALQGAGFLADKDAFVASVKDREKHASTAIGFGVAIPHGKSSGVKKAGIGFARLAQPVEWNSLDGKPVSIIILLAIPQEEAGKEHLRILASVSKQLIHESFRKQLLEAKTEEEIVGILESAL